MYLMKFKNSQVEVVTWKITTNQGVNGGIYGLSNLPNVKLGLHVTTSIKPIIYNTRGLCFYNFITLYITLT